MLLYQCPAECGCMWRDNMDGTMSLANEYQHSCDVCEILPLDKLKPVERYVMPDGKYRAHPSNPAYASDFTGSGSKNYEVTLDIEKIKRLRREAEGRFNVTQDMIVEIQDHQTVVDEVNRVWAPTSQLDSLGSAPAGDKFDDDKVRMELLPVEAMMGTARVLSSGARKYSNRNWEKGIEYSRVYGALMRHMTAWWNGEDLDPETGESHMHHAGCCIAFLQTYVERGQTSWDNRPHTIHDNDGTDTQVTADGK